MLSESLYSTTILLYGWLPVVLAAAGLLALVILVYDRWHTLRQHARERLEVVTERTTDEWQRRPRFLQPPQVAAVIAAGIGVAVLCVYKGTLVLAVLAIVGAGVVLWSWREWRHTRWARELDDQALLLARHLRNRLAQEATLLVSLEQAHTQTKTLAEPLDHEIDILLQRAAAGEQLGDVLLSMADSPRYRKTQVFGRLLFHLGHSVREYMTPRQIADLLGTFIEVATLVKDTQDMLEASIAQIRYSRWIVSGAFVAIVLLIMRLAPEFGSFLLYHIVGNVALGLAVLLVMMVNGIGKKLEQLAPLNF